MSDPASPRLRAEVHARLDPIWQNAAQTGGYSPSKIRRYTSPDQFYFFQQSARTRVYLWLAEQMWLTADECHVSKFTAEQCRTAMDLLVGVSFKQVRRWSKQRGITVRRRYDAAPGTSA